ncbi:craniofacial development protein 2-like [Xenia sp. Carnegie-2017]|uniref:craniofacial development protein 2-like n=1 Tax=Xenia sp. Carnegie-2017 TaxID=2897299 RepID=UPI001F049EFB|nr:craniofacial development protein 2-like [Xenia sp. Carnegie-2017]
MDFGKEDMAPSPRQPFSGQGVRRISGSNGCGSVTLRVGTVNVGTMKGRSAEVADMLKRRKVDVCGFQEVRFKGEGTRVIKGEDNGARFKWFWKGNGSGTNGVGFAIREDWAKSVVAVKRVSDRVLRVDVVIEAEVVSFVVVYAPQVGRSAEEKEKFYDSVYAVRADIRGRCVMLGDWNGHVGSVRKGYCAHGGFGVGDMNAEGETILELAASCGMVVVNTWFIKEESKLVTYESGDSRTVVDYILVNEEERKNVKDAKVIAGEECVTQHKLLVMDWRIRKVKRRKVEGKGRLKLWKLRSNEGKQCFRDEIATLNVEGETVEERWTCLKKGVLKAAEKVCCRSKGGVVEEQAWWWDQRVSEVIGAKLAFKGGESRGLKQIGSITSDSRKRRERRWLKRKTSERAS